MDPLDEKGNILKASKTLRQLQEINKRYYSSLDCQWTLKWESS
jgi:hypothetical protein